MRPVSIERVSDIDFDLSRMRGTKKRSIAT